MAKKRKVRKKRVQDMGEKQHAAPGAPPAKPQVAKEEKQDDYGGMDLSNFRKNLGCG